MTNFNYQDIDDLIHSRIRLAIMAILSAVESASFKLLKEKVGATDGNLSVHLRRLEEAQYVTVEKAFIERKPISIYSLSTKGKNAFTNYINYLEAMLPNNPGG